MIETNNISLIDDKIFNVQTRIRDYKIKIKSQEFFGLSIIYTPILLSITFTSFLIYSYKNSFGLGLLIISLYFLLVVWVVIYNCLDKIFSYFFKWEHSSYKKIRNEQNENYSNLSKLQKSKDCYLKLMPLKNEQNTNYINFLSERLIRHIDTNFIGNDYTDHFLISIKNQSIEINQPYKTTTLIEDTILRIDYINKIKAEYIELNSSKSNSYDYLQMRYVKAIDLITEINKSLLKNRNSNDFNELIIRIKNHISEGLPDTKKNFIVEKYLTDSWIEHLVKKIETGDFKNYKYTNGIYSTIFFSPTTDEIDEVQNYFYKLREIKENRNYYVERVNENDSDIQSNSTSTNLEKFRDKRKTNTNETVKQQNDNTKNSIPQFTSVIELFNEDPRISVISSKQKTNESNPDFTKISGSKYLVIAQKKQEVGLCGEEFVYTFEKEYLESNNRNDLAEKVLHISKIYNDSYGYDIESYDLNGNRRFIEVKTSIKNYDSDFYISQNELNKMSELDNYFIYRLFNLDMTTGSCDLYIIDCKKEFDNYFTITPVNYIVKPNKK